MTATRTAAAVIVCLAFALAATALVVDKGHIGQEFYGIGGLSGGEWSDLYVVVGGTTLYGTQRERRIVSELDRPAVGQPHARPGGAGLGQQRYGTW